MNVPSFTPMNPMYPIISGGTQNDEKERIMEKVYSSDVFKEFIRQWGNTLPPLNNVMQQSNNK